MPIKISTYLIFIFLFANSLNCKSQRISNLEIKSIDCIELFFKQIKSGRHAFAIDSLLKSNESINLNDSSTIILRENFDKINKESGAYLGHRLLKKRMLEEDISVFSYLVKYEKLFYRFLFIFYKNDKGVLLYKFSYDDTLDIELEESIKLYL